MGGHSISPHQEVEPVFSAVTLVTVGTVGFAAGLFLFKVKSRWCRQCGSVLSCPSCGGREAHPQPGSSRRANRRRASSRLPRSGRGWRAASCGQAGGSLDVDFPSIGRRIAYWLTRRTLAQQFWPFERHRRTVLGRLGTTTICPKRAGVYRAVGVAQVTYLPERPLLTLAGEHRAGLWA